ncbi:alpha/beta fold hydrolase [Streptomyces sulphureus]|uniref:alpha/beta fold hydrolase n=1 Tax=Streptomyces sulphureus TaxID=47758 RepID=UPI00035DBD1A|nr:alpha/beta fold hydrolase [Streptomyces sulphureus]
MPQTAAEATTGAVTRLPGLVLTDRHFHVPLDPSDPGGEHLTLYAREAVAPDREAERLPWLLFLQGGPGGKAPRPLGRDGWLDRALQEFRVLLLDQRGTGLSAPVDRHTLPFRGTASQQAEYLAHFRADTIVQDCEAIRHALLGDEPWSVLGQSFGGFCALSYLSHAPEGLREALLTGGLPALGVDAADSWRAAFRRCAHRVEAYYERYPQDVETVRTIVRELLREPVLLPDGGELTAERFQALGNVLGADTGAEVLHHLLQEAFTGGADAGGTVPRRFSDAFLAQTAAIVSFAQMPLFPLMVEPSFDQAGPTRWAAQRVRDASPELDAAAALEAGGPVPLTGEAPFPWAFRADPALRPLEGAAEALHARGDWPPLYDPNQLAANEVPAAAAVYFHDFYVDTAHSLATADRVRNLRTWVTSEYEHNGLRADGFRILDRLLAMVRGRA